MQELEVFAKRDMAASLSLNDKFSYSYLVKHFYEKFTDSNEQSMPKNLGKALKLSPNSYWVWYSILESSAPRWSGSSTLIKKALQDMQSFYPQNPKLASLQSFAFKEAGDQARFAGHDQQAMEFYIKGLRVGYHQYISMEAGRLLSARGDWKDACILFDDALEQAPYFKQAIGDKAECDDARANGIVK